MYVHMDCTVIYDFKATCWMFCAPNSVQWLSVQKILMQIYAYYDSPAARLPQSCSLQTYTMGTAAPKDMTSANANAPHLHETRRASVMLKCLRLRQCF